MWLPNVIEKEGRNQVALDIPSKLLQSRIVYFFGEVDDISMNIVTMQLLLLAEQDPDKDIDLYINSGGGSIYSGLQVKDVIDSLSCKVNTVGMGIIASMGTYLLACGTGTRKSLKNTRIMIHSAASGMQGKIQDLKVDYKETEYLQSKMMVHLTNFSKGKSTLEDIEKKCDRDYYMDPEEAMRMGLIDEII